MVIRELLLKLGLDLDAQSFAKGELAAKLVEKALGGVIDVAKEVAAAFVENIKSTIEYGSELNDTSQAIGITTDALQELRYAGSLSGLSAEEMTASVGHLSRSLLEASQGSEEQSKAFAKLGVHVKDAHGKVISADDALGQIADKFEKMPDGVEKTALAMQVLGRGGKQMVPLLNEGREGLEKLRQEAHDLGLVMDEEFVKVADDIGDNLDRVKAVTVGLWRAGIAPLLPAIGNLVKRFLNWQKANAGLIKQKIEKYVGYVIKAIEFLADTVKFLSQNFDNIILVAKGLAIAFVALNAAAVASAAATLIAWAAAAAPFIALAAAIAGVLLFLDDIQRYREGRDSLFGDWAETIKEWQKPNANDPWWLRAIKELVIYMEKALGIADKLGLAADKAKEGKPAPKNTSAALAQSGNLTARDPITGAQLPAPFIASRSGIGDSASQTRSLYALEQTGSHLEAFKARLGLGKYGDYVPPPTAAPETPPMSRPEYIPPPASQSLNYSPNLTVQMTVTTQPGQSNEQISSMVSDQIQSFWDSNMEAAHAAVK